MAVSSMEWTECGRIILIEDGRPVMGWVDIETERENEGPDEARKPVEATHSQD